MRIKLLMLLLFICLITDAQSIFNKESVKAILDRVNNYRYVNSWKEFDDSRIRGTCCTGVMGCYKATGEKKYLEQCDTWGKAKLAYTFFKT
jgi:rhamnogalacturonyl hydrolase YesR